MVKKFFLLNLVLFSFLMAFSQDSVPASRVTAEGKNVKVVYGQASKKDSPVFGASVPYGEVWRVGVNSATEITFANDGSFGGLPIKAGTYTLLAIPNEKEWTIILNSALKQSGVFKYNEIKDKDVLKVNVPVIKLNTAVEKLTCRFTETHLVIEWQQTQVAIPVSF